MSIDLDRIKGEWKEYVWSEEKVRRLVEEDGHSFDPLIKRFLALVNYLPFMQTSYACSGHGKKNYLDAENKVSYFRPFLIFINSMKKYGVEDASELTRRYVEDFYSSLKFMDDADRNEATRLKKEIIEVLSFAKENRYDAEKAKLMLNELSDEFSKIELWNSIVIQEGCIRFYLFNFNKFTKNYLSGEETEIKNDFSSRLNHLVEEINRKSGKLNKLMIETIKLSEDAHHLGVQYILRYKPSNNNQLISVEFNEKYYIGSLAEALKYMREVSVFWKEVEKITEDAYNRYKHK